MTPVIIPLRFYCPVCRPSRKPGYVTVHLPRGGFDRLPVKVMPCPACNGGDIEYTVRLLSARVRSICEEVEG